MGRKRDLTMEARPENIPVLNVKKEEGDHNQGNASSLWKFKMKGKKMDSPPEHPERMQPR